LVPRLRLGTHGTRLCLVDCRARRDIIEAEPRAAGSQAEPGNQGSNCRAARPVRSTLALPSTLWYDHKREAFAHREDAMFSSMIPLPALAGLCRNLRHMLESGLTLSRAMRQQAKKGPPAVRTVAARMATRLEQGDDLQTILPEEADHFPPIFLALGGVAEETGRLPEVLHELEEYFELQQKLKRDFISQCTLPAIQFVFVAFILIPGVIYLLGMIEGFAGKNPFSVFGLKGESGVVIWYTGVISFVLLMIGGYWAARNLLHAG